MTRQKRDFQEAKRAVTSKAGKNTIGSNAKRRVPRAERRAQLLAVAREIINQAGIGNLTMSALAETSGAAKPIVYQHFTNSEDVAVALLHAYFTEQERYVRSRLGDPRNLKEYLRVLITALFDYHAHDRLSVRSITNGFSSSSKVNDAYMAHQQNTRKAFHDLLALHGIAGAELEVAAYGLMTVIRETAFEFVGRRNAEDSLTMHKMVDGIIDGLTGPKQ